MTLAGFLTVIPFSPCPPKAGGAVPESLGPCCKTLLQPSQSEGDLGSVAETPASSRAAPKSQEQSHLLFVTSEEEPPSLGGGAPAFTFTGHPRLLLGSGPALPAAATEHASASHPGHAAEDPTWLFPHVATVTPACAWGRSGRLRSSAQARWFPAGLGEPRGPCWRG